MIKIKESAPMKDVTPAQLSKAEARSLTDRIKTSVEDIRKLVAKAHDGKAWKPLGYSTWEDYVKSEFGISRRHADRLIEQGEVIEAIEAAVPDTGPMGPISERTTRELKDDLPSATAEIRERVERGEKPEDAAKDIAAKRRAEKEQAKAERAAEQAESNRRREEFTAKLPDAIKRQEQAKADAIAKRKAAPIDVEALIAEVEGLREAKAALEAKVAELTADNAKWEAMRVQFEQGGFEKVIAGKDAVISGLETRLYGESQDKASWMKSAKYWQEEARKLGWKNGDPTIDIETGEVVDG